MRTRSFLLALLLGFSLPVFAAPPSEADIDRLLKASRAQSMLDAVLPQMETMQRQQFEQMTAGKNLSAEQKAEIERLRARTTDIVRRALAWEEMKPLYVQVYQQTFTRDDVRAITKFYESPAGQRMLDKNPALMQNLMAAIQQKMVPMLQELETELKDATRTPAPPASPPQKRRKK